MDDVELEIQTDRVRKLLAAVARKAWAPPTEAERDAARREFLASLGKGDAE
ncbi:hypothetical protein GGE65_004697 [Skermanella aerolata]|uniref:hypothetical protein n=1 Tax=Skermanella aerolata TaxID=393310 RepID=UPI003D1DA931